jgi:hypothetical protein
VKNNKQGSHLYDIISSATIRLQVVFLILNMRTYFKAYLIKVDVKGAYLRTPVSDGDQDIIIKITSDVVPFWIKQDPEAAKYVTSRGEVHFKLDKYLYGLKQSSYKFQQHLSKSIKEIGYAQSLYDESLFYLSRDTNFSLLSIHADDILHCSNSQPMIKSFEETLSKVYKDYTYEANPTSYLGMTLKISNDRSSIHVSQEGLSNEIISKYLEDLKQTSYSPAIADLFQYKEESPPADSTPFLSALMSIMYVARLTRPDILLATTYLATKAQTPTIYHWKQLLRIVKYLNHTKGYGVTIACKELRLIADCDASWSSHTDSSSHTGWFICIGASYLL